MTDNLKKYLTETLATNDGTRISARLLLKDLASLITDIRCLQHLIEGATEDDGDEPSLWVEELADDKATLKEVRGIIADINRIFEELDQQEEEEEL